MNHYHNYFSSWEDVKSQFCIDLKEPKKVLLAYYDYEDYGCDGRALVIFYDKRKYGIVVGGHCSCFGLENQWEPEYYSKKELKKLLEEKPPYYFDQFKKEVLEQL